MRLFVCLSVKREKKGETKEKRGKNSSLSLFLSPSSLPDQPRRLPRRHHLLEQRLGVHHVVQSQDRGRARFGVVEVEGGALVVGRAPGEDLPNQRAGVAKGRGGGGVGREEGVAVRDVAVRGAEFLLIGFFF